MIVPVDSLRQGFDTPVSCQIRQLGWTRPARAARRQPV